MSKKYESPEFNFQFLYSEFDKQQNWYFAISNKIFVRLPVMDLFAKVDMYGHAIPRTVINYLAGNGDMKAIMAAGKSPDDLTDAVNQAWESAQKKLIDLSKSLGLNTTPGIATVNDLVQTKLAEARKSSPVLESYWTEFNDLTSQMRSLDNTSLEFRATKNRMEELTYLINKHLSDINFLELE